MRPLNNVFHYFRNDPSGFGCWRAAIGPETGSGCEHVGGAFPLDRLGSTVALEPRAEPARASDPSGLLREVPRPVGSIKALSRMSSRTTDPKGPERRRPSELQSI